MRSSAAVGTSKRRPIWMTGIWPLRAASLAWFLPIRSRFAAAIIVVVSLVPAFAED